jgi:phosphopentomutase
MDRLTEMLQADFHGLCFVNLVDFDMLYGTVTTRRLRPAALERFDKRLADVLRAMKGDEI